MAESSVTDFPADRKSPVATRDPMLTIEDEFHHLRRLAWAVNACGTAEEIDRDAIIGVGKALRHAVDRLEEGFDRASAAAREAGR